MQTTRIGPYRSSAPTTDFYGGADSVAQSQAGNYTVVRVSATAINRGNTSSFINSNGAHTMAVDGYGQAQHAGTMPSGYATNQTRWDDGADIAVGHDGNGNMGGVTLRQTVSWSAFSNVQAVGFYDFPRIPKAPSAPGTPVASNVLPTSLTLTWTASTDNAGSAIDGYLVRRWDNAEGTGAYTDVSQTNTLTRVVTGLTPGKEYRFAVYAHNGSAAGYSVVSGAVVVRTLSGFLTRYMGHWKRAVPYVKVAGVWKAVSVFVKDAGHWKQGA